MSVVLSTNKVLIVEDDHDEQFRMFCKYLSRIEEDAREAILHTKTVEDAISKTSMFIKHLNWSAQKLLLSLDKEDLYDANFIWNCKLDSINWCADYHCSLIERGEI